MITSEITDVPGDRRYDEAAAPSQTTPSASDFPRVWRRSTNHAAPQNAFAASSRRPAIRWGSRDFLIGRAADPRELELIRAEDVADGIDRRLVSRLPQVSHVFPGSHSKPGLDRKTTARSASLF
jgi:hypothetical protein